MFPIELPPLRKRKEDIALLAEHLLGILSRRLGKQTPRLTQANVAELGRYDWPGNIRELQHVLERASITSPKGKLRLELNSPTSTQVTTTDSLTVATDGILTASELRAFEAANIRRALLACDGKVYGETGAAALLGMKPTTLSSRIKSLGVAIRE